MIGQDTDGVQTESTAKITGQDIISKNAKNSALVDDSQVDVHTFERSISGKVCSKVDSVMASVKTKVHDAILTAMESLVFPGDELPMKSVNAYSQEISKAFR